MKKLLLAATALTAIGGVGTALADVTVSGYSRFNYHSWSDETAPAATPAPGSNNSKTTIQAAVTVKGTAMADNGLNLTASQTLLTAGADTKSDGISLDLGGDWGNLMFADGDGYGDDGETSADVAADESTTSGAAFDGDSKIDAFGAGASISYKSPKVNGFQLNFGYGDGGDASNADATAWGVSYSTSTMGAGVTLKYASSSVSSSTQTANDDAAATSAGVIISADALALTMAQNTQKVGAKSYTGTGIGVTYQATDELKLALHSKSAEDSKDAKYDYGETALSASYKFAPGLDGHVTYTDWSHTTAGGAAKKSGTYTNLELQVSF